MSVDGAAPGAGPDRRDASLEGQFFRQLQHVTTCIHETDNLDQLMLAVSADICALFNADRMTLYALSADRKAIESKVKTGLNTSRELKLPLGPQSLAGYVAASHQPLNLADVYDEATLRRIDPSLHFLREVDQRSGYRTKQMLVLPITHGPELFGVLQLINSRTGQPFTALEVDGATQLCKTLSTAIRQRQAKAAEAQQRKTSPYDGLVSTGAITLAQLQDCERQAQGAGLSVEQLLLRQPGIGLAHIGESLARFFGVSYEPAQARRSRNDALHGKLKRDFIEQQLWLPLEESPEGLVLMCIDPEAVRASRVAAQIYPRIARYVYRVTTRTEFDQTFAQFFSAPAAAGSIDQLLADLSPAEEDSGLDEALASAAADNELVKFVNKVILDAHAQGASDIHIEPLPGKEKTGIRFRIDGGLVPYVEVPAHFRQTMVTRLKIMCDLDISERRKPQDGKIRFKKYAPLDIELRVATIPSAGGVEDVVLRILAAGEPIPLDQLGLSPHNRARVEATISRPHGLFYVCGPTGSGKTTTLHSILKFLNRPDTKIWTAEDPVEITQKGLRQVQINKKAGIDFALVMRAFLRADPDVIMVGESRDRETVAMGVEASLTGHLVFSTLHTNSAPESIVRLLDMGMDPFNFADALLGILAQRLARRLCDCKQAYVPDVPELQRFIAEYADPLRHTQAWQQDAAGEAQRLQQAWTQAHGVDGQLRLYRAAGCARCNGTGYKGRIALHELLVADEQSRRLIQERARVALLFNAAVESGMRTLKMDGLEKVLMGLTDIAQVRAVCIQ